MKVILSHRQFDFDAIASMLAAYKVHPDYTLVIDGKSNAFVQDFLALAKDSLPFKSGQDIDVNQVTNVILVDTQDLQRAGSVGIKLLKREGIDLLIYDHHPYAGLRKPNLVIEQVGACATILVEKIKELSIPLSSFEATLLALGIYDDTGSLIFETTTSRDVKAVAYLIEQGANLGVVASYLQKSLSQEQKDLLSELLDNGKTEVFRGLPVFITFAECSEYIGGLALLAHRIGEIEGAETLILAVKMENRVYLVGRSRRRGLPVNEIMKTFGGAGHENAASANIKDIELSEVLEKLKHEIELRARYPYLVKDIMSHPVRNICSDTTLKEAEQLLLKYGHTGVPVVDEGRLVGLISRRDVEKAVKHGLEHAPVKGFMTREVIVVSPESSWEDVHKLMVEYDIGRIPVVENSQVIGIVSRSDILRLVHGGSVPIEAALARDRSLALRKDIIDILDRLPKQILNLIEEASKVADVLNYPLFIVGGFVRDLLLNNPTQDLDFVVEGNSKSFVENLATRLKGVELTFHSKFGTARLTFEDGTHIDVARSRWEYYEYPGALPEVEESGLKEDLFRRDFTINAMAICLNLKRYGELVDYYGGLRDLRQKEIRVLHNLSFIEDPTRILRAIRFAKRYDFKLSKETEEKIVTSLHGGILKRISTERFTQELYLILEEKNYQPMFESLAKIGVFKEWFGKEYNWEFGLEQLEKRDSSEEILARRWLGLLWKMKDEDILELLNRLKLSKTLRCFTIKYVELRARLRLPINGLIEIDTLLKNLPHFMVDILILNLDLKEPLTRYFEALGKTKIKVDGLTLRKLGVTEGPQIGLILNKVREAWLEGKINSQEEETRFVRRIITEI